MFLMQIRRYLWNLDFLIVDISDAVYVSMAPIFSQTIKFNPLKPSGFFTYRQVYH